MTKSSVYNISIHLNFSDFVHFWLEYSNSVDYQFNAQILRKLPNFALGVNQSVKARILVLKIGFWRENSNE